MLPPFAPEIETDSLLRSEKKLSKVQFLTHLASAPGVKRLLRNHQVSPTQPS